MALDFPSNPVDGEIFDAYIWNASKGVWQAVEEQAAVTVASPTAPTSATVGDLWFNTTKGLIFVYYDDGSSAQWVEVVSSNIIDISGKANLSGGNTFNGTQTFNTPIAVSSGGTGTNTLSLNGYLKGAGTSAITSQSGLPAGDLTSGTIPYARFPVGTVVQVQSTTVSSAAAYSVGANALQSVGLDVAITPRSATNKILVIATLSSSAVSFARPSTVLLRNSTRIGVGDAAGSRSRISGSGAQGETAPGTQTVNFLDSPATTSSVTYRAQMLNLHSATQQYNFNYDVSNSDNGSHGRTASTITVMEIVA